MESLLDEYKGYIDKLCDNLMAETYKILEEHKDSKGKVYVCAISRKMPKLLDILHERLEKIWDKLYIVTEIAIPFLDWTEVKAIILADDAIYFGSTFTYVYHTIKQYAPNIDIVPICAIKASEAILCFDDKLKTEVVPRQTGHYFVNCLSIDFRKHCSPFEVEFPVFELSLPAGYFDKVVSAISKNKYHQYYQIYSIDNGIRDILNKNDEACRIAEYGMDLSEDNIVLRKIRFYFQEDRIYFSSICSRPILQQTLESDQLFKETIYSELWQKIKKELHGKSDTTKFYSLSAAANFIYSIDLFFFAWNHINIDLNLDSHYKNILPQLCIREVRLLFGEHIAEYFMKWFDEFGDNLIFSQEMLDDEFESDIVYDDAEFLPKLDYAEFYFSVQDKLIRSFTDVNLSLSSIFFAQGQMLDKMNRIFVQLNKERLKYGHTFGSILSLLSKNQNLKASRSKVNRWVDAQIDNASIVPQYIETHNADDRKVWRRVFRSGENEIYIISHWARLCLQILQKEKEMLGMEMLDEIYFNSLLSWFYQKYCLDKYTFVDATYLYDNFSYLIKLSVGKKQVPLLDILKKMNILVAPLEGYVAINEIFNDDELLNGTVLPSTMMKQILEDLEAFHQHFPDILSPSCYLPFFDSKLFMGSVSEPAKDVVGMLFKFMGKCNAAGQNQFDLDTFSMELRKFKAYQISNFSHTQSWFEKTSAKNDENLKKLIDDFDNLLENANLTILQNIICMVIDPIGAKDNVLNYLKSLQNPKWDFLQSVVSGNNRAEDLRKNLFSAILKRGRSLWIN